ncbi:1,25-dihydroxyvitamin D(3) 24-hydroxylase, mitochondrial-like [Saccoglossus kowalevskii]|uniref:1,25-dihydroxyvitamin D(3) 24-hydroxylase, mitochondrial-like n=1 Tax=Saccoglossus kowalevskii TaxID=10224 RepID=A0ABM0GIX2_SACKO|nr:PREDICTED: 1,25-dihydroxyvitamin D(3) 24-hydroxylase, mitochondrial-like [Saccoglossus kowalevskii]
MAVAVSQLSSKRATVLLKPRLLTQIAVRSSASNPQSLYETRKHNGSPVKPFEELPGTPLGFFRNMVFNIRNVLNGEFNKPFNMLSRFKKEYGPIWRQQFGSIVFIMLTDVIDIEKVCRHEGKYPRRVEFSPWVLARSDLKEDMGVLLSEGADWHRNRVALSKRMLRPKQVATYTDPVNDVITDMLAKIERTRTSANENNLVPDIENILFSWALDSACSVILSKKMGLLDDKPHPEAHRFIQSVHDVFSTTLLLFVVPATIQKFLRTPIWRKHVTAWDNIFTTAKKLIDVRVDEIVKLGATGDVDFLTYMVGRKSLSSSEIYADATELLMAAVDTTSSAFIWTLYNVARHPQVQEALYEEVNRVIPKGKIPTHEDINKLPYLKAILKETTRLYPPVVNVSRILETDIVVSGYNVPAGTALNMAIWMVARDPQYFDDPDKFKPERWLREENESFNGFKLLPFGFGPRMCIGKRLAELEIHLALARISQKYILESTTDVEATMTMLQIPDRPLNLRFIDRGT